MSVGKQTEFSGIYEDSKRQKLEIESKYYVSLE